MIQHKTILSVFDNCGVKKVKCIRSYKDKILLVSILDTKIKTSLKKGSLISAILVRKNEVSSKKNGISFVFDKNGVVLINSKKLLVGTRFFGPVPSELRRKKYLKIMCLAVINV